MKNLLLAIVFLAPMTSFACYRQECGIFIEFNGANNTFRVLKNGTEIPLANNRFKYERRSQDNRDLVLKRGFEASSKSLQLGTGVRLINEWNEDMGEDWTIKLVDSFGGNALTISPMPDLKNAKNENAICFYTRTLYVQPEIAKELNELIRENSSEDIYINVNPRDPR